MNRSKKIVGSVFIALLIVCLILSVVGIGYYTDGFTNFVKDSPAPVDVVPAAAEANNLNVVIDEDHNCDVIQSGEGVVIQSANLASAPQNAEGNGELCQEGSSRYIRHYLTATVLPEDAKNRNVEWALEWVSEEASGDPSDYITLVVSEDTHSVELRCIKPFTDKNINVIVTTVVGNFSASCVCAYGAEPFSFKYSLYAEDKGYSVAGQKYLGECVATELPYIYNISLVDRLLYNCPDDLDLEVIDCGINGSVVMKKEYIVNGSVVHTENVTFNSVNGVLTCTYDNIPNHTYDGPYTTELRFEDFVTTIGTSGNLFTFIPERGIVGFVSSSNVRTGFKFTYVSHDQNFDFYFTLRDKTTGYEEFVYFDIVNSVESVSLDNSSLEF